MGRVLEGQSEGNEKKQAWQGIRRRVKPDSKIPGNWTAFLRIDQNKEELFHYLADELTTVNVHHGQVISTKGVSVICNVRRENVSNLSPCNHEEADTRLLLRAADAAKSGFTKIMLKTVDTDVVVLSVAAHHEINLAELWIAFGSGKHLRYIPAHDIASKLGKEKSKALLAFHAFTGCDQTSSFANVGKKTAWDVWNTFNEVTQVFQQLSSTPSMSVLSDVLPVLERYTVLMYDRTSSCATVDAARKDLFTRKGRELECIPPTSDALRQHAKRVVLQAGYYWGTCLEVAPQLPPPSQWGWQRGPSNAWQPLWMTIPQASQSCQELLKCGCKSEKGCTGRCKCVRAELPCTSLCQCGGLCNRH